ALGLLAVLGVPLRDLLGGRGVAELLHAHAGMGGAGGGDRGKRPGHALLGLLLRARQLEADDHGTAVARDGGTLDPADAGDAPETARDVVRGGGPLRTVSTLYEDALGGLLREGGLDDHVAALGLAAAAGRIVDAVLPDLATDDGGEDDEQDP